jgi:HK97 family phage major capsid protein
MNVRELLAKRANLVSQARELHSLAERENRDFNQEEANQYNAIWGDIEALDKRIQRSESLAGIESEARSDDPERPESGQRSTPQNDAQVRAFDAFLRTGAITPEFRALQADSDVSGGFMTTPQQFVTRLIKAIDDLVYMRQWGTMNTVANAQSLGMPYLAADPSDADWTSELGTGNEDTSMSFGKRELSPKPLAKRIKVSNKLLRLNPDVEGLTIERLAYKFAISLEKAGLTGSGANQPLGVFTASDNGIPTSRDVATGNTTTALTFDGIKEAKYSLKAGYWREANWLFHRTAIKNLAKLKDGEGRYVWQNSVQAGQPDLLEGLPVGVSEYVPSTFTAGLYVGILGAFRYYHWADALDFSVQRLNELYAATNQTGFIGRLESDGMPVLAEAFVRVTLAP